MAMSMGGFGMPAASSSGAAGGTGGTTATVAVDKATSELLIGPDWTMNMDICDSINSHHWQAKDVVKQVKKRLQHKNPQVQLLALTLLETMVKNCGDYIHFQIADKKILDEMVKIVKKKTDMRVRDRILVLVDAWQEAFGGPGGKYPQYYWAYEDLRRCGVQFPQRSPDAAPIFTPPVSHPPSRQAQAGYGMPINSARRLDETMAADVEGLSLASLDSMRDVMELLNEMLQAVNPGDQEAVKDELIVDLVNQCRSNQKKLMQMITTTGDEELLGKGLELNDRLQLLLAKHDAIVSGSPMPAQVASLTPKPSEGSPSNTNPTESKDHSSRPSYSPTAPAADVTENPTDNDEEEEDEFAQLARRHSKSPSASSSKGIHGTNGQLVPVDNANGTSSPTASTAVPSNALALPDPPTPVKTTTKDQDMIDLLSLTLSTVSTSPQPHTPQTPLTSTAQNMPQMPASSGFPNVPQTYPGNQGQVLYNSYVVPWAQPQPQHQLQLPSQPPPVHPQYQLQFQSQAPQQFQPQPQKPLPQQQFYPQSGAQEAQSLASQHFQQHAQHAQPYPPTQQQFYAQSGPQMQSHAPHQFQQHPPQQPQPPTQEQFYAQSGPQQQSTPSQSHRQFQSQPQYQSQPQPQPQPQYPQYPSAYPPPPWAATPGYANGSVTNKMFSNPRPNTTLSYTPTEAGKSLESYNSFPSRGSNSIGSGLGNPSAPGGQKPFIPSYRLFEDLNVLGDGEGKYKTTSNARPSMSGTTASQSMGGGRK